MHEKGAMSRVFLPPGQGEGPYGVEFLGLVKAA